MHCREFLCHLHDYLRGEVSEPLFGALVEHEADCSTCRSHAARIDVEPAGVGGQVISASEPVADPVRRRILERTAGRDCRWVELRMAEALEDEPAPEVRLLVSNHVAECAACRRMRDMLQALPSYYELLPELRPSAGFVSAVINRTVGPRPSFFDVVRALWRKPEAMWEGAMACALAIVLIFGKHLPTVDEVTRTVQEVSQATGISGLGKLMSSPGDEASKTLRPLTDTVGAVRGRWESVESGVVGVSEWARRFGDGVRNGDPAGVLQEIRVVLEPLGLYPSNGVESESVLPGGSDLKQMNIEAPAGADSSTTETSGEAR